MSGELVTIGPFDGGLNLREEASIIADNQLSECINFDVGRAGELTIRPGLKSAYLTAITSNPVHLFGTATKADGTTRYYYNRDSSVNGQPYLYHSDGLTSGAAVSSPLSSGSFAPKYYSKVVQLSNIAYIFGGPVSYTQNTDNNSYNIAFSYTNTVAATLYKQRLFAVSSNISSRVIYSVAGDPQTVAANSFFDVDSGDGDYIVALETQNEYLIIFKRKSTWVFTYDTDPARGTLRRLSAEIGATNLRATTVFNNDIYFISQYTMYRMSNLQFDEIGQNMDLQAIRNQNNLNLYTDTVSVLRDRIVFAVYTGNAADATPVVYYVFDPEINTWTEYKFDEYPERFFKHIDSLGVQRYIATNNTVSTATRFYALDNRAPTDASFGDYPLGLTTASMGTKEYRFNGASFKRLFWWGVEAVGSSSYDAYVVVDGVRSSAIRTVAATARRALSKIFVSNRFRSVQFVVATSSGAQLTVLSTQASIGEKREVSAAST